MDIIPSASATNASNTSTSSSSSSAALTASSDFETFLSLLTAQLENQDPLNPLESTDFVAQLASFSAVEQQVLTNSLIEDLTAALTSSSTSEAAQWLDREVLAATSTEFTGEPLEIAITPDSAATQSVLEIRNEEGLVAGTVVLPAGTSGYSWDGSVREGSALPEGRYSFSVLNYDGADVISTSQAKVFAPVVEVQLDAGVPYLVFADGARTALGDVTRFKG